MRKANTSRPRYVTPHLNEVWEEVDASFERFCLTAGIEALQSMMEGDAAVLCGPRHARGPLRQGYRWGRTHGKIGFHGGKVEVERLLRCPRKFPLATTNPTAFGFLCRRLRAHEDVLDMLSCIFDLWPGGLPFPRAASAGRSRAITDYDELNSHM